MQSRMRAAHVAVCGLAIMLTVQPCTVRAFQRPAIARIRKMPLRMTAERTTAVTTLPTPVRNEALEAKARAYFAKGNKVKQQLGPTNKADLEDALADDFEFVAPLVGPLTKAAIVEATAGLDLATAIPNFDARYHHFRADASDPLRIWCQMRVTGTHTGELFFGGLGGVSAKPQDPPVTFSNPPEAVSLTFDQEGRVRRITTGYPLDRRVGTTGGLGGLFGVFEGIGFPLPSPLTRSTGHVLSPILSLFGPSPMSTAAAEMTEIDEAHALPEERLLRLTADLIAGGFGCADPSLLADNFQFTGPVVGPLDKAAFVKAYSGVSGMMSELEDLEYNYRDARVCTFDVNRVWYTSSPTAYHPKTGRRWISPPECGSAQFDADGKCVALTGGYIMDRTQGNTEGLGGVYGMCAALGLPPPTPLWQLYTPVQNFGRFQRFVGLKSEPLGRLES